jgi:hypothetical protein
MSALSEAVPSILIGFHVAANQDAGGEKDGEKH